MSTAGLSGGSPTQSSPFTAFAKQRRASVSTSSGSGSPEFRNSFGDEPAVIEEGDSTNVPMNTPVSPSFARRVSFGAQALRDVKGPSTGGPGGGGRRPSYSLFTLNENTAPSGSSAPSPGSTNAATTRGKGGGQSSPPRSPHAGLFFPNVINVVCALHADDIFYTDAEDSFNDRSTKLTAIAGEGFNWSDALRDKTKRSPSLSSNANSFASNTTRNRSTSIATMEPPKEMPKAAAAPPRMKKPDALGERMLRGEFMMD